MPTALIVGSGIGGLAAGIALRRAGWAVRIFERAATPRELGFGVGMAPNAIAALRELGVAAEVLARAVQPLNAEIRRADGTALRRLAIPREAVAGRDVMTIVMRPSLHGALLDAVGLDAIELESDVTGFVVDGGRVLVRFASGSSEAGDILIGADGVGSVVRAQLHPGEAPPRPSGYFALRGASHAVEALRGLQALIYYGPGIESGVVQASPDTIYWFLSLLADDVRGGASDPAEVLGRHTSGFDPQYHAITRATAPADMRLDELFVREPISDWGSGPVTLLGDAAHPMLPHTGQGAAQALEDAVALGRILGQAADPVAALREYERIRAARTRRIVNMGPRLARFTTTRSPMATFLRDRAIRLIPEKILINAFTQGPAAN